MTGVDLITVFLLVRFCTMHVTTECCLNTSTVFMKLLKCSVMRQSKIMDGAKSIKQNNTTKLKVLTMTYRTLVA